MKIIYALGVGASTPVFCEIAIACGYEIGGLYHYNSDRNGEVVNGMQILGSFEDLFNTAIEEKNFLLTMGDPKLRHNLSERIIAAGGILPTLIHPTALISPNCTISTEGVIISPMVVVQSNVKIDKGVAIWDMALICHDAIVDSYVFIGPKALVGAAVHVSPFAYIGQAAVLISHKAKEIGCESLVGAGAVVTKSVEEYQVVAGQPARAIKKKDN
ncbi:MAG: transferase [Bacteroidales bacterium]|nr:transferase [Bacteroidales bacterium]